MTAEDIMFKVSEKYNLGWDMETMFWIMNGYIDNQQAEDAWRDYCETIAAAEVECSEAVAVEE